MTAAVSSLIAPAIGDDAEDLQGTIAEITSLAQAARTNLDFETVEQKRLERFAAIEAHAEKHPTSESAWVRGLRALEAVDGVTVGDKTTPGLVNELRYRDAADILRAAWADIVATPGPVFGEIAVRLVDLSQQALGVFPDAMTPDSPSFVASKAELEAALGVAIDRDPCCVLAVPYKQFFATTSPPATEAFLRAEARPILSERQQELVAIGHPVIFPAPKPFSSRLFDNRQFAQGGDTDADPPETARKGERIDTPLMPWHAAVEFVKADNLQLILDELDYASFLTPDTFSSSHSYVLPGKIIEGKDASGNPFQLLYGRFLYCSVIDENAVTRSAVLYLDAEAKWHHRYLDVLYRHPTDEELKNQGVRKLQEFFDRLSARATWTLGDTTFSLYNCPLSSLGFLIARSTKQFCVRDANKFALLKPAMTSRASRNALDNLASPPRNLEAIFTSWEVWAALQAIKANTTSITHPLVSLMRHPEQPSATASETSFGSESELVPRSFNPLLLVSESERRSRGVEPHFFRDGKGPPYLRLTSGEKLLFHYADGIKAAHCSVDFGGVTVNMPLHPYAIPPTMILATGLGKAFHQLFVDVGYAPDVAIREILKCLTEPNHRPAKADQFLRKAAQQSGGRLNYGTALRSMLSERGWPGSPNLSSGLNQLFFHFGYRHLRDARGNWIYPRRLTTALSYESRGDGGNQQPQADQPNGQRPQAALSDYPFEFRSPDGEHRIATSQIYSWEDYQNIKDNKYTEHLRKLLVFHPCFPAIEAVHAEVLHEIEHPDATTPEYLGEMYTRGNVDQGSGNSEGNLQADSSAGSIGQDRLTAPIAVWQVNDDKLQQQVCTAILSAYTDLVLEAAQAGTAARKRRMDIDRLDEFLSVPLDDSDLRRLERLRASILEGLRNNREQLQKITRPLLALQLESARFAAKQRYYHKAIIFYNDLLAQIYPDRPSGSARQLFVEVGSTENARKFISYLETVVSGYELLTTVQLELAGVLCSAGLKDSAYSIWKGISDDIEFFVTPAIDNARTYLESYGIRFGDRIQSVLARLDNTASLAREGIRRYELAPEWKRLVNADSETNATWARAFQQLEKLSAMEKEGLAPADLDRQMEEALRKLAAVRSPGFANWFTLKRWLLDDGRFSLLFETELTVHPAFACPVTYDPDAPDGFQQSNREAVEVLRRCEVKDVENWATQENAKADVPSAIDAAFLMAWYWHDNGEFAKARSAITEVARLLHRQQTAAVAAKQTRDALIHERNYMAAVLAATSIAQTLPGLSGLKSDYSALFIAQLADWERRWFSASLYGPHATQAAAMIETTALDARRAVDQRDDTWRHKRLFFKDYTFEFGPIPDYVLYKALTKPDLFRKLDADADVAGQGNAAVANDDWVIEEPNARYFLTTNVPLDPRPKKDIVLGEDEGEEE